MRPIKFRVWTGMGMEYQVVVGQLGAFYVPGLDPKDKACISPLNTIYSQLTPVMQYTGLLDKNGCEIYEGDVLTDNIVVSWHDNLASFCINKKGWMFPHFFKEGVDVKNIEVIGNVHENPELVHDTIQ